MEGGITMAYSSLAIGTLYSWVKGLFHGINVSPTKIQL